MCCWDGRAGVEVEVVVPPAAAAPRIADAEELPPLRLFREYAAARELSPEVRLSSTACHFTRAWHAMAETNDCLTLNWCCSQRDCPKPFTNTLLHCGGRS